jgi:hypothetical protein
VTHPLEIGKNRSNQLATLRSSLERNERSGESPEATDFDRRMVVIVFTRDGEKSKSGRLVMTPMTRLGRGALGS